MTSGYLTGKVWLLRLIPPIMLLLAFAALGSGAMEYVHNRDHRHDAARHVAAHEQGQPSHPAPLPDDNNCRTHAQLHMPAVAGGWVPLLVCLGLFVAFLTLLTPEPVSHRPLICLDCRGPPAC